jgi:hypothetical protein
MEVSQALAESAHTIECFTPLTLHAQIGKKLIPAHASFTLEELRERVPGLLMEEFPQGLFRLISF